MKIEAIMTTSVVTVEMDDSLKVIKDIFDNVSFHHLLVVESGKLFGVISDRDLLRVISPNVGSIHETEKDLASLNKRAHQILTRRPVTLTKESTVGDAIKIFNEHTLSCIPVVDEASKPVGLVSWRDVLNVITHVD